MYFLYLIELKLLATWLNIAWKYTENTVQCKYSFCCSNSGWLWLERWGTAFCKTSFLKMTAYFCVTEQLAKLYSWHYFIVHIIVITIWFGPTLADAPHLWFDLMEYTSEMKIIRYLVKYYQHGLCFLSEAHYLAGIKIWLLEMGWWHYRNGFETPATTLWHIFWEKVFYTIVFF